MRAVITTKLTVNHTIRFTMKEASILIGSLLLSACGSFVHDSAPDRYIDHTRIKNAVPIVEPPSKYGNPQSYVVQGERYHAHPAENLMICTP